MAHTLTGKVNGSTQEDLVLTRRILTEHPDMSILDALDVAWKINEAYVITEDEGLDLDAAPAYALDGGDGDPWQFDPATLRWHPQG